MQGCLQDYQRKYQSTNGLAYCRGKQLAINARLSIQIRYYVQKTLAMLSCNVIPSKRNGFCGTSPSFDRSWYKEICSVLILSIVRINK